MPGKHNDESQILQAWVTKRLCSQLDRLAKLAKTSRAKYVKKVLEEHVSAPDQFFFGVDRTKDGGGRVDEKTLAKRAKAAR